MNKERTKRKEEIVKEYLAGEATYRELSVRHGYSLGTLHRWVKEAGGKKSIRGKGLEDGAPLENKGEEGLETEVRRLRKELKMSGLHNEFLNELIDIAGREMGVDIRKKGGSRRR
jgi:transposase-like protein